MIARVMHGIAVGAIAALLGASAPAMAQELPNAVTPTTAEPTSSPTGPSTAPPIVSVQLPSVQKEVPGAQAHGADLPVRPPRSPLGDLWGEARARLEHLAPLGLDAQGTLQSTKQWLATRVVAGGRLHVSDRLQVDLELEGANGLAAGDRIALGTAYTGRPFLQARDNTSDLSRVVPRKAMLTWTTDLGQVLVGAQSFGWGAGLLASDGKLDNDFGDAQLGNVVARLALATRPLARWATQPLWRDLAVFVAADYVLRDDNASVWDGDRAQAGVLGVRASDQHLALGLLVALRNQTDRYDATRPGDKLATTQIIATDAWARWQRPVGPVRLGLEGEVAVIAGHTTRPYSDETLANGADVRQVGALGRLRVDHDASHTTWKLQAGYASGDNDIRDGTARQFTMHSDHRVGLVLFGQVLPLLQARSLDRLADPGLVAVRPPAARFAVQAGGQVANAAYLQPVVRWRPLPPLDVRLGYVLAVAAADVADPYQTAIRGGFATTPGGTVQGGRTYGHEVDARVSWDVALPQQVTLRVGAEGGVLVPGAALAGVVGLDTPWLARGLLTVLW